MYSFCMVSFKHKSGQSKKKSYLTGGRHMNCEMMSCSFENKDGDLIISYSDWQRLRTMCRLNKQVTICNTQIAIALQAKNVIEE